MSIYVSDKVGKAFAPSEKLTPSQWAERYRVLTNISAEPGPYRMDRTPYMRGIIDAITEPGVIQLVIMKSVQVGYTTMLQNLIGWSVDQEPGPSLFILPTKEAAKALMTEQLQPLIDSCQRLRDRLRGDQYDVTADTLNFDSMSLYMGSMGSPITMQGRAIRYVWIDEPDRGPLDSAGMGNPIDLGFSRLTTFGHRGRMIVGCTPSVPENHVNQQFEACGDRRYYHVPCPFCSTYQRLVFSQLYFSYEDVKSISDQPKRADYIESKNRAAYQCKECKELIPNARKAEMLTKGVWVSEGQTVDKLGNLIGERPKAARVGFHISALYSPWVSWPKVAAKFTRARGDRGAMQVYHNEVLGEPFREITKHITVDEARASLAESAAGGIVPKWAGVLISTVDVHGNRGFRYVIRAWGRDRSQLVEQGEVQTFEQITATCLNKPFMVDGGNGDFLAPSLMFIDAGYRTDEVYDYCKTDPRIMPVMGHPQLFPSQHISWNTPDKALGLRVGMLHTQYYKDVLQSLRVSGKWLVNQSATDEYFRHLAAEAKTYDPKAKREVWRPTSSGAYVDYLDCEVYQVAASTFLQVSNLPDEQTLEMSRLVARQAREKAKYVQPQERKDTNWLGNTKSWTF